MAGGDRGEGKDSPSPTEHMFLLLSSQIQTDVVDTTTSQNNIKIRGAANFLAQNDVQHFDWRAGSVLLGCRTLDEII